MNFDICELKYNARHAYYLNTTSSEEKIGFTFSFDDDYTNISKKDQDTV